ncbi:MAG: flavin reductase FMN-binding protein [Hyphomicrobiales bacterium]|jgi:flavin reductase (DIM6/NTAB) family NADH-FMN oxidoreductase RutF|nr:flavin reductase FMN-binding protein [Hyphomicrobiales bacterium]
MRPEDVIYQPEKYWDRLFAPGGHASMITTVDEEGRVNAASYATTVRIVHNPVQIAFTTHAAGQTAANILATNQFVVNLPSFERDILEKVRVVGLPFAKGVNELEKAGLTAIPSQTVKAPRILECTRHFECEVVWVKEWQKRMMIVGNVLAASVHKGLVDEKGYLVWEKVKPVAFCGAPYVNMFAAGYETMEVGMPYEGPEVQAADKSVRSYFDDM